MCGLDPWVSLRFYWLLPPGSHCVTWKLAREKALASFYLIYLEAKWIFLKAFPIVLQALGTCPDPSYQTSPPTFLTEVSEANIIFPHSSCLHPKAHASLPLTLPLFSVSCPTLPKLFCFLLFPALTTCWSQWPLVAEQMCKGKSELAGSFYCIGGDFTGRGLLWPLLRDAFLH